MHISHYPSLLVLINRENARLFRVEESTIEMMTHINDPKDSYSDREGFFATGGRGVSLSGGEPDVIQLREKEHLRQHVRHTLEELKKQWLTDTFHHLTIVVPGKYKGTVENDLKHFLPQVSAAFIDGNYPEADKKQLRELFLKSLRPQ